MGSAGSRASRSGEGLDTNYVTAGGKRGDNPNQEAQTSGKAGSARASEKADSGLGGAARDLETVWRARGATKHILKGGRNKGWGSKCLASIGKIRERRKKKKAGGQTQGERTCVAKQKQQIGRKGGSDRTQPRRKSCLKRTSHQKLKKQSKEGRWRG